MRRVVRGFWGPRKESVPELAGRWKAMLDALPALLPAAGSAPAGQPWTWTQHHGYGRPTRLRPDGAELGAALQADHDSPQTSDGAGLSLASTGEPGWEIGIAGRGGGESEYVTQAVVLTVVSPDGAEVPEAALLALIADIWQPDIGDVTDDDLLDALEDDAGYDYTLSQLCVGRLGYFSPGRAALVPDGVGAVREELGGEGLLLDIAPPQDIEAVVDAYVRLRDAGALEPLPRPMNRTTL
ncbi:hypothetical protein [Streptomyces brevispora]|uniref:Uncharacterized protein n=1 Tax=Streptomyces brevispora TaxID=887462 RepID=A0A561USJ1_9ACTN|nr:hypothetical protein [Streptomyces brevispora]TWG02304.1 hypothetical protein FHX80_11710 [Streptomyces brevispora]WSC16521.1 hypothetical protein OIE64_29285 [Streptomyces brevispora]